ncbi:MAG: hypothetical protein HXY50_14465, partial [Ignavibacteriaceae bacterium]|nr:hypothetical protein [Ignavibacteriaceae bacterium]
MISKISFLFFLIFTCLLLPQEDIKVISSDKSSIIIEFTPKFSTSKEVINDDTYINVRLMYGSVVDLTKIGSPAIPERQIPIGVPSELGTTFEILSTSFSEIEGKILPIFFPRKHGDISSTRIELTEDYKNSEFSNDVISFGEFAIVRGMPFQYFNIRPVAFSAASNRIKLFNKIIFRINFNSKQNNTSNSSDNFLENIIPNFKTAKNWINEKHSNKLEKIQLDNSVLASGKWIRFEAKEEGIYRINRATLASFGIDPNAVDPRTIKIYNNGGKVLSETVNSSKINDLVENAIIVTGESDGKFDTDDYILFYGRGTNFWDYDKNSKTIKRYFHPYSSSNYYWLTYGGANGKRMQEKVSLNTSGSYLQTSTPAFGNWEEDKINIGKTGRVYLGDDFTQSTSSRTYMTNLDGRINNTPITYDFKLVNASSSAIIFGAEESGAQLFSQSFSGFGNYGYSYGVLHSKSSVYSGNISDSRSVLKIKFTPTSATSLGYLDYFEIRYQKELKAYDDYLLFFSKDTSSIIEYDLTNFKSSNITVLDVSNFSDVKIITNPIMQSGGEFRFQSQEISGAVSKYIAIESSNYKTPSNPTDVMNQNVRGFSDGAKFIIIYHKDLKEQAERLKNYRENNSKLNMSTVLVEVNQIYNEFSCGQVDVTAIRDFIKYAYDNWNVKPEYVLLFGDGTYDSKNLEKNGDNLLLPYETLESLDEIYSYSMDDYFARVDGNDSKLDLAVGRLNVSSNSEAEKVVDKIIDYENAHEKGIWRNLITLVADDNLTTTGIDAAPNTPQSEDLAETIP